MEHLTDVQGTIKNERQISPSIRLTESLYRKSLKLSKHFHEHAHFCLLLDGSFSEICGNRTLECKPMSLSFLAAGEVHSDCFHSPVSHCFIIDLAPDWMAYAAEYDVRLPRSGNYHGGLLPSIALKIYNESKSADRSTRIAIEGLALELLVEASRRSPQTGGRFTPGWLRQVRDVLHDRFAEPLTHAEIAELVSVHPGHLAREFRQYYHCTIGEYLRQLRIDYACLQICTSNKSLTEIALDAGFFDQSHFSRIFKKITGLTPIEYRKIFCPC